MTVEQQLNINFTGIEANTLFFEPIYQDPDVRADFRIISNVTTKRKLAFVQELEKVVRQYSGCGFTPAGNAKIYERTLQVDKVKVNLEWCWEEFKDTVYEEALNKGISLPDISGTLIFDILQTLAQSAIKKDNSRLAFFGDRASVNPDYDATDGLWTVYIPQFVAANQCPYTNTNSGVALAAGDGIDYLRAVYNAADVRLKGLPNSMKKFYVSGSIFEQYREDIENGGGGDAGVTTLQNGQEVFSFRGIEVKPMWLWDEIMTGDFASPNTHYILYTTPQNLVFGTDLLDAENQFKVWYNDDSEAMRVKVLYKMGFNVVHPSLLSVGY
jgi:hypothetical protein